MEFTEREKIVEIINKLFIYTDSRDWKSLQREVFSEFVDFDMSSLGGKVARITSEEICRDWEKGFEGIDEVYHLSGNYIVNIHDDSAEVFAYAIAAHYKSAVLKGKIREFAGSYNFHLTKVNKLWKIDKFKYNLKYMKDDLDPAL